MAEEDNFKLIVWYNKNKKTKWGDGDMSKFNYLIKEDIEKINSVKKVYCG